MLANDLTLLLVLAEPGEEEGDADDEEDDEDPDAVDEHGLAVLVRVAVYPAPFPLLVGPDLLLQVSHARGRPRQHQDAGAEVLVHHQHPRPHRGGQPQQYFLNITDHGNGISISV